VKAINILVFLFAALLLFPFPLSAKPIIATSTDNGLLLSVNIPEAISQNQTRTFETQVFTSTGYLNESITCHLFIYRESSSGQEIFYNYTTEPDLFSYIITTPASIHETKGEYSFRSVCEYLPQESGSVGLYEKSYYVTKNGFEPAGDLVTMLIYLMFITAGIILFYSLIMNLIKLATLDATIFDVLLSWSGLILMMFVIYLAENFLISTFIEDLANTFFYAVTASNGILPLAAFILSFIVKVWTKKKKNIGDYVGRQFK
jgi:hypothetical protein